jgi:hypothetical protein
LLPANGPPAQEHLDTKAKAAADVLLFEIAESTRGSASIAEVSYFLGAGRPLALMIEDVPADAMFDGRAVSKSERDDLNRGRPFVKTMEAEQGVPEFTDVAPATAYTIELVNGLRARDRV